MSAHCISFFMKRVYHNDMTRAFASVIFIIVNKFHKDDMFVLSELVLNVSLTLFFLYTIGHSL